MATTKKIPSPVQVHAKREDIDIAKVSSGNETDRKEEDVDAPEMCPGRRTPVPSVYLPATTSKNIQQKKKVKEEVPPIPEKSIGGDIKKRSEHAYGLHGTDTAPNSYPNPQPGKAEPRCLHVGDLHAAVYSEQESEDTYGYREAEEVVNKGYKEESGSHNYHKPDGDVYGYEEPVEEVSFAYRAKGHVNEIWKKWKSSRVCWFALGCGLLVVASVVISVILATHITHGGRVS
ncbi:PREDICTED: uncharacterized protein LOC109464504 [Branchiostoma belcheri]|uniref:Uncharacterized protein LOC109464504 n=1 Tax=Branchiostoma belcheri TaxID=7741 RepID=A0A6P4Y3S8_BRABE|nr:PREDICTED: uncharacterized protein LOC109464504 [Branchiostoma belcheri]